jgi:ribose/xylose/arabinose/galactoside ABC-type transport system permease subunit
MRPELESPTHRMGRRLSSRLLVGIVAGLCVGLAVGAIAGIIVSAPGRPAFWLALVGCSVFATAMGAIVAGYSSLESPDPGAEPSDTESPILDRPEMTREEHEVGGRHR